MQAINEKQESDRGLLLQRGADGAHSSAYRIEIWRITISFVVMLASIVATIVPAVVATTAIVGAAWSFVSVLLMSTASQRRTEVAAKLQHQFDTRLCEIPWESYAGEAIADEELRRWARKSKLAETRMRTWYPDVADFPLPYAVLSCQRESLTLDWRLRRRFASALVAFASAWSAAGIGIGLLGDLSVRTVALQWFVPSSAALILALRMAYGHSQVASAKDKWSAVVRSELAGARPSGPSAKERKELMSKAAEVQQGLFVLRQRRERVPRPIYERYRDQDEADMRETTADLRRHLGLA